jgi:aspartate-semialdehyde dehydrogenase
MHTSPHPAKSAVVGATGAVGRELLALIAERGFPNTDLLLTASARSAGTRVRVGGHEREIRETSAEVLLDRNLIFLVASGQVSRDLEPMLREAGSRGVVTIDNSSAFRLSHDVPLVVPEVNSELLDGFPGGLVANPNCSTIIMLVAVHPIRAAFGVNRVTVATYQAVSGAGAAGMAELDAATAGAMRGDEPEPSTFGEPCAFNVFSHDSDVDLVTGRNVEEQKMIDESRKIWKDPSLPIEATCVRVPVRRAHTEAINVSLTNPATETQIREVLTAAHGIEVVDDRAANRFPTPRKASGRDSVLVGRIRPDASQPSVESPEGRKHFGFSLLVAGDQLRKGAALNAIQIAECVLGITPNITKE